MKLDLNEWNMQVFGIMDEEIEKNRKEIQRLDQIDESSGLDTDVIIQRKAATSTLLKDLKFKDSLLAQESRCRWIKEGVSNSRYFHNFEEA